jgi:hypothetical protein
MRACSGAPVQVPPEVVQRFFSPLDPADTLELHGMAKL